MTKIAYFEGSCAVARIVTTGSENGATAKVRISWIFIPYLTCGSKLRDIGLLHVM